MKNPKITELENRLIEVFGENASLALTTARLGSKGYFVRIESYGMPFTVDAYDKNPEEAEELAIEEFNKQMVEALDEKLFPTQPLEKYEIIQLSEEELNKVYKYSDIIHIKETFEEVKKETIAKICKRSDGKYECVISGTYMHLNARGTARTKELAITAAIWTAHEILNPSVIKVGNYLFR